MYKDLTFSATIPRILIVKTSSLGDIIQSFPVLDFLHSRFPNALIDWTVEESLSPICQAHPLIRRAIPLDIKGMKKNWRFLSSWKKLFKACKDLRREKYDYIFDIQGNTKSGAVTLFARGRFKVGFGRKSVREWPNLLATQIQIEVPKQINIRLQHLRLLQQFFKDEKPLEIEGLRFKIEDLEKEKLFQILYQKQLQFPLKVMVCPGSKWPNKQIPLETMISLLNRMAEKFSASFLLVWGTDAEKKDCEEILAKFPERSLIIDRLSFPTWQNLMSEVDLVLAVDSSALHLCGTTSTPSFSVFGPTSADIYKPIGARHFAFEGRCPYGRAFEKTCPILRSCSTGACIRGLTAEEIFQAFLIWWEKLQTMQKLSDA